MENKINIAELLKDCPKGMELDCTMFDNVTFEEVITVRGFDDKIRVKIILSTHDSDGMKDEINLTEFGTYTDDETAKCVIFPKGKTTWDRFVSPGKFKDGDICYVKTKKLFEYIFIFKVSENYDCTPNYVTLSAYDLYTDISSVCAADSIKEIRLATEEEKQKLFDAIKANGYRWNEETKTLEKLPKFKIGDRIKKKGVDDIYAIEISLVGQTIYTIKSGGFLYIESADRDYELASSKFDITTLKPFESRVLVRDYNCYDWEADIFGRYSDGYITLGGGKWKQCIPYNDETKHLLGTTNDCGEFYKTW